MATATTELDTLRVAPCVECRDLFPLPLVPFELFLLQDERPGYPMTFCVEMVFLGRMNRAALFQAIGEAASRHPLLLARIEQVQKRWHWVLDAEREVPIDLQDEQAPFAPPRGAAIDLRTEPGLRVWIREDAERTSVTFQFHHACCDGEGSRHFGHDVLTGYSRIVAGQGQEVMEWTRVDYQRLRERAVFHPPSLADAPLTTSAWQKVKDAYQFHVLGPTPLAGAKWAAAGGAARPLVIKRLFSRPETAAIEAAAMRRQVALNDAALGLLFQTLADWNCQYGKAPGRQRLRVLMPTDMRERADRWLTATNRTSFSFLTRTVEQCADWESLVSGIVQETQYIKRIRLGLDFINIMGAVQGIPGLLPVMLRLPRCMATCVLTNLGDTTRRFRRRFPFDDGYPVIGDVRLEQVVGAPPLRKLTRSGFGICFCAGHMALSLRPDPHELSPAAAQQLLDNFVAAWERFRDG